MLKNFKRPIPSVNLNPSHMRQRSILFFLFFIPVFLLLNSCEKTDDTALDPEKLETWRTYTTGNGLGHNTVWSMLTDSEGTIWCGTENGVSRYDGSGWQTFRTSDGLIHDIVYSIEQDRFGDLWFGTEEGISIFDGSTFSNIPGADDNVWSVRALKQASNGSIWIGTAGHGFFELTTDGILYLYYFDEHPDLNFVNQIVEDDRNNIWVSTYLGVFRVGMNSLNWYSTEDGLTGNQVISLLADSWGHVWLGTFGPQNLNRYVSGKFEELSLTNGAPENHVMSMMEDSRGNIWLGQLTMGVTRYDGAVMRTYLSGDGLASDRILSMTEGQDGNLWFGTFDAGVSRYTPGPE